MERQRCRTRSRASCSRHISTKAGMRSRGWLPSSTKYSHESPMRQQKETEARDARHSTRLRELLRETCPKLAVRHRLEFKRCFGAVTGYVDGNIFVSCGEFGVALKLPSATLSELFREEDVLHLRYFSNGQVKKEYAVIPGRIIKIKVLLKKLEAKRKKSELLMPRCPRPANGPRGGPVTPGSGAPRSPRQSSFVGSLLANPGLVTVRATGFSAFSLLAVVKSTIETGLD